MKPACVSVDPNPATKTITITARLSFYTSKGLPPEYTLKFIKRELERIWSGHHFKCWAVVVKVEVKGVKDKDAVADDALDIELVDNIDVPYTWVEATINDRPLSDDPSAREAPERGNVLGHSTWSTAGSDGEWAHEFGHVLGLDDGYDTSKPKDATGHWPPIPGHTLDLMSNSSKPVSAQMITRLLRRLGVDESKIKCPITFDAGPSSLNLVLGTMTDLTLHAWACDWDPPSDDATRTAEKISFQGIVTYSGGYLPGAGFSEARSLLGALTRMDLSILATEHSATFPLDFEIHPFTTSEKLVIKFADKLSVEGNYIWDAKEGLPVMAGPMTMMGMSTAGFFPGPPLEGRFKHGAAECPR